MASIEIQPADPSYPAPLWALVTDSEAAPPTLYLRGALPASPGVAIVGTRAASDEALRFARELAAALGAAGFSIWSGGARGVDAAAHEGALAARAPTVVVSGGGHAHPYPREHAALFDRVVAAGGALLSRVADDTPPMPALFLQRNVVLAALTIATVVVEAGIESGARSTAAAARRLGRHLCVVPRAPWDPRGIGCALELVAGARPVTRAADVIDVLGGPAPPPGRRPRARRSPRTSSSATATLPLPDAAFAARPDVPTAGEALAPALTEEERAVLGVLDARPAHVDEVCERTGLPPRLAVEALLTLTLQAVVVEGPAGLFRRALR
ncbi:DNA processing protein DprA [Sorangium cellulosum]|uniref:DNA processing protein DprA n=1 Tax=Sorangium cellulosum TaxID=56 RepID=A0A2L0EZW8_SORCE|nr:DNA-processing protein DprA [Sorangium cellulosum]AUX44841.1 DNA processing protein DprA [Sorangium cellulosum]